MGIKKGDAMNRQNVLIRVAAGFTAGLLLGLLLGTALSPELKKTKADLRECEWQLVAAKDQILRLHAAMGDPAAQKYVREMDQFEKFVEDKVEKLYTEYPDLRPDE